VTAESIYIALAEMKMWNWETIASALAGTLGNAARLATSG